MIKAAVIGGRYQCNLHGNIEFVYFIMIYRYYKNTNYHFPLGYLSRNGETEEILTFTFKTKIKAVLEFHKHFINNLTGVNRLISNIYGYYLEANSTQK